MFKSLNEVLIEWNESPKKDSENTQDTFISVKGDDLTFHFKFVFTNDEEPPLRKKGCFRDVDWGNLFIWMSNEDSKKLWDIIYNRLNQLLGNKDKCKKAFLLLKENLVKILPAADLPYGEPEEYGDTNDPDLDNLGICSEDWYYFIWYLIIENIPIEIYKDNIKSKNLLYRGTLENLQYQEDSNNINNNLAQISLIPVYYIGRFIQSITEPGYGSEAFPCMLINEFVSEAWKVPMFWDDLQLDYSNPKVIDIIKSIRKSLNIK